MKSYKLNKTVLSPKVRAVLFCDRAAVDGVGEGPCFLFCDRAVEVECDRELTNEE